MRSTVTVRESTGAPATALINAAQAKAKGFEAELTGRPVEGLMLNATWGYIDGKITKTTPVAQAQGLLVGNRLTKTPKNKISLAAQYEWEIFGYDARSEEHTSELQSLKRITYGVFCLKKKNKKKYKTNKVAFECTDNRKYINVKQ